MGRLTQRELQEIAHWRGWCFQGGQKLEHAPMAILPLLAIIDKLTGRLDLEAGRLALNDKENGGE